MSLRALSDTIEDLPYSLTAQTLSYARSVEAAAPEIFRDADVRKTKEATDILVFIAGMRKLFSILDSNYRTLDNAGAIMSKQQNQHDIRVGGTYFSRDGDYFRRLKKARHELITVLSEHKLIQFVNRRMPYAEIVRGIANGH